MSEEPAAPGVGEVLTPAPSTGELTVRDAARSLTDWRHKLNASTADAVSTANDTQAESADTATPAQESEVEQSTEDAAPSEGPSETAEQDDPAEKLPSIDPPRSWTKEDKEIFTGLPRETQERLVDRERSRETDFLRRQNEAAEQLKGLTAKEQAAEQVRQQYESALPALLQTLYDQQQGEFSDIKTMADVERLAREDWPRYALWDAQQKKIAVISQEVTTAQQRQSQKARADFDKFASDQDKALLDKAPELSDPKRKQAVSELAVSVLKDIGFSDEELAHSWNGQGIPLRDHRMQLLLLDGVKYRESQEKQKTAKENVAKKPLPPVQRPGAAKPANAGVQQQIQALNKQLATASGIKAAQIGAQIMRLERQAAQ